MTRSTYIIGAIAFILGGLISFLVWGPSDTSVENQRSKATHSESDMSKVYTCSMHPSVEKNSPGDCPICGMDLVSKSSTVSNDPLTLIMSHEAVKLSQLEVSPVKAVGNEEKKVVRLSGLLKEDLSQSSRLVSYLPGELVRLNIESEGERVEKGQIIGEVYVPELRQQQEELLDAARRREESPELYHAARKKLDYWKIDSLFIERLLKTQKPSDILPIYATASGTVRDLLVTEGDMLKRGQSIARVAKLSRLWAEFDVPESELNLIRIGQIVRFNSISGTPREYTAKIYYIDPEIDVTKRTAIARARISAQGILKPEMTITGYVSVHSQKSGDQVKIPASAVLWTGPRSVVYVRVPYSDVPSYSFREVKLDRFDRDMAYISDGLEVGEEVVSQGAFVVDAAAQLNNQKSMMNRMVELEKTMAGDRLQMNPIHQKAAEEAFDLYFQLKDALVDSDSIKSQQVASELYQQVKDIPATIESPNHRDRWASRQQKAENGAMELSQAADISEQRKAFEDLSESFIFWLRHFQIAFDPIYRQYCPMALDNTGADWISIEQEIRNPYFGDKMLKCGTVKEVFE